jgi:hypothetical protein
MDWVSGRGLTLSRFRGFSFFSLSVSFVASCKMVWGSFWLFHVRADAA